MRGRARAAEIMYLDTYSTLGATPAGNPIDVAVWRLATGVAVVQVGGEVDAFTAPTLRAELADQLNLPPPMPLPRQSEPRQLCAKAGGRTCYPRRSTSTTMTHD